MSWIKIEDELPPEGNLVLVDMGWAGMHLRSRQAEDWYDDNENYDDSGIEVVRWHELPQ